MLELNIFDINIYSTDLFLETLFLESMCDDPRIIEENVRRVKISSPDVSLLPFPTTFRSH
jgi:6-phosphofructo-2-kinase